LLDKASKSPGTLLLILGVLLGSAGQWLFDLNIPQPVAIGAYLLAAVLFVMPKSSLFSAGRRETAPPPAHASNDVTRRRSFFVLRGNYAVGLFVVVLFAFALGLRLVKIGTLPFGLWYDEALYGMVASRILNDPSFRPVHIADVPAGFIYLIAGSFAFLGESRNAIRVPAAILGAGSVVALFYFARSAFGLTAAIGSSLLLAVSRWHLTVSRVGMEVAAAAFFSILSFMFLWQVLRSGRTLHYLLLGLSLGLGAWFYPAFWAVPVGICLLLTVGLLRRASHHHRQGVIVLLVIVFLSTLPLQVFAVRHPTEIFPDRYRQLAVFSDKSLLDGTKAALRQVPNYLLMYVSRGEQTIARHNIPGRRLLAFPVAVLATLGLSFSLTRWRHPTLQLLLLWFVVGITPAILTKHLGDVHAQRAIMTLPVAFLFAGVALARLDETLRTWHGIAPRALGYGAIGFALLSGGYLGIDGYFRRQAQNGQVWASFSAPQTVVANFVSQSKEPYDAIYLTPDLADPGIWGLSLHPTLRFLARRADFRSFDSAKAPPLPPLDRSTVYFIGPPYASIFHYLRETYPGDYFESIGPPDGAIPIVYIASFERHPLSFPPVQAQFAVAAHYEDVAELVGLDLDGATLDRAIAGPCGSDSLGRIRPGTLDVVLYWKSKWAISDSYTVSVQLLDANGQLVAQHDGRPLRGRAPTYTWRPGQYVADPHPIQIRRATPAGCYKLIAVLYNGRTGVRLGVGDEEFATLGTLAVGSLDRVPQ